MTDDKKCETQIFISSVNYRLTNCLLAIKVGRIIALHSQMLSVRQLPTILELYYRLTAKKFKYLTAEN